MPNSDFLNHTIEIPTNYQKHSEITETGECV